MAVVVVRLLMALEAEVGAEEPTLGFLTSILEQRLLFLTALIMVLTATLILAH